jgi:hypothetical protein
MISSEVIRRVKIRFMSLCCWVGGHRNYRRKCGPMFHLETLVRPYKLRKVIIQTTVVWNQMFTQSWHFVQAATKIDSDNRESMFMKPWFCTHYWWSWSSDRIFIDRNNQIPRIPMLEHLQERTDVPLEWEVSIAETSVFLLPITKTAQMNRTWSIN